MVNNMSSTLTNEIEIINTPKGNNIFQEMFLKEKQVNKEQVKENKPYIKQKLNNRVKTEFTLSKRQRRKLKAINEGK